MNAHAIGLSPRLWRLFLHLFIVLASVTSVTPVLAQTPSLTLEQIGSKKSAAEGASGLSDEQRQEVVDRLDEAANTLKDAQRVRSEVESLRQAVKEGPNRLKALRAGANPVDAYSDERIARMKDGQLRSELDSLEADIQGSQERLAKLEQQLNQYLNVARNGSARAEELNKQLSELTAGSGGNTSGDGPDALMSGSQDYLRQAKLDLVQARLDRIGVIRVNIDLLTELAQLERDQLSNRLKQLREQASKLRIALNDRREQEAEQATEAARKALDDLPKSLQGIQRDIAALVAENTMLVRRESNLAPRQEQVERLLGELERDHERIQHMVDFGGRGPRISALLQQRRDQAPSPQLLSNEIVEYQRELSEAVIRQLALDERLRSSRDAGREQALAQVLDQAGDEQKAELEARFDEVWTRYRESLRELWRGYTRYVGRVGALEAETRKLLGFSERYREFINNHLLWMPSVDLLGADGAGDWLSAFRWMLGWTNLKSFGADMARGMRHYTGFTILAALSVLGLVLLRPRARRRSKELSKQIKKIRTDSFSLTLKAGAFALILILPVPVALIALGLLVTQSPAPADHSVAMGVALQGTGFWLLLLIGLRQMVRDYGLAREHLGWGQALCDQLNKELRWLIPPTGLLSMVVSSAALGVPNAFIEVSGAGGAPDEFLRLGQVAMAMSMGLLMVMFFRLFSRKSPVMSGMKSNGQEARWLQYHVLWFDPLLLVPFGLGVASLAGYFYTSVFLSGVVFEMVWYLLLLTLAKDLILRGLYVAKRRLQFQEAVKRREEAIAKREADENPEEEPESEVVSLEDEKIDIRVLGDQVGQLIRMGFGIALILGIYWIWAKVLPSFNALGEASLSVDGAVAAAGIPEGSLSISEVVTGLLLGVLSLLTARHVPALLELTILQRLPISRAVRYASTTLAQYLVVILGVVVTFRALGLEWSNIQWLVAALSVGLGFGLQEIVANFVSGIILLFEQPIRVGDVVTVEGTTGTVSRIRIRATTIVNFERQELVIPNKTFITGQLINWTLSDTVNRAIITVGVAYGTDTKKAMELLDEIAQDHPLVLSDPAPRVTFELFGDNTLNLLVRVYMNDIDHRLTVITDLHQRINECFEKEGITIAFPQRDVHLDTSRPLELVLRKDAN